ncbi:MAG: CAP domain-containing protein [Planctomycetes bacterium]|nr:CAP domain-containing protein [Planctomycetota bacterium]
MRWLSQWWNGLVFPLPGPVPVTERPPVSPPRPRVSPETEPIDITADVNTLVRLVNEQRGVSRTCQPMARLNYSAQIWAECMAENQRLEHRSPLPAGINGEIIAWGSYDAASTFQQWMNSPPHRAIMLDGRYRFCGFGRDGAYWCGVFAYYPWASSDQPSKQKAV